MGLITPQTNLPAANNVFATDIQMGLRIVNGKPQAFIRRATLQQANVDTNGKWTAIPLSGAIVRGPQDEITFSWDDSGNSVNLPADLASLAAQFNAAFGAMETIIAGINTIRKVV